MRRAPLAVAVLVAVMGSGCFAPVNRGAAKGSQTLGGGIYSDEEYFENDGIYENRDVKFSVRLSGKWDLRTDPKEMQPAARKFASDLEAMGTDLLFSGTTADGRQATRCIVTNNNMSAVEYATAIRSANADSIEADSGLSFLYANDSLVVKWEYTVARFRFVEFFYQLGTYDLRLAFWSEPATFERFRPIYENSAKSVRFFGF